MGDGVKVMYIVPGHMFQYRGTLYRRALPEERAEHPSRELLVPGTNRVLAFRGDEPVSFNGDLEVRPVR